MLALSVYTYAQGQTKMWALGDPTPVWRSEGAYASTVAQADFGAEAFKKALKQDAEMGRVEFVKQGTNCIIQKSLTGNACLITVEGLPGFWYTSRKYFGK